MTVNTTDVRKGSEWLSDWDPEDEASWNSALAWRTLVITTFALTLAFSTWFLASAIAPTLTNLGFALDKSQLYWLTAMPGLAGGTMRLIWMWLPPVMGTRKLVTLTTALLLIPLVGWGMAVQNPSTTFTTFLILAFLSGIGGGAFSGFMPSTSYFFPRRRQGTALGLQAGIGNFGVSIVQFVTPWIIGFSLLGVLGASQTFHDPAKNTNREVWEQNAAFIYVPFVIVAAILAWTMLKSVPVRANFRQQLDIFKNADTWWMTALYVMTFGIFSGLAAQFGLLIKNLYGAGNPAIVATAADGSTSVLVQGYSVQLALTFAFLGPLVGAGARVAFSALTDKFGGARWTLVAGIGILVSLLFTLQHVTPDPSLGAESLTSEFHLFLWGFISIFFFTGIGNAATFKQMPMIFERRQAGGVIGWVSAIAAYGPFLFGVALAGMAVSSFLWVLVGFTSFCIGITWFRYARPGAPKPS